MSGALTWEVQTEDFAIALSEEGRYVLYVSIYNNFVVTFNGQSFASVATMQEAQKLVIEHFNTLGEQHENQ